MDPSVFESILFGEFGEGMTAGAQRRYVRCLLLLERGYDPATIAEKLRLRNEERWRAFVDLGRRHFIFSRCEDELRIGERLLERSPRPRYASDDRPSPLRKRSANAPQTGKSHSANEQIEPTIAADVESTHARGESNDRTNDSIVVYNNDESNERTIERMVAAGKAANPGQKDLTRAQAAELLTRFGPAKCLHVLDYMPFARARNPAAFLQHQVANECQPPKAYQEALIARQQQSLNVPIVVEGGSNKALRPLQPPPEGFHEFRKSIGM